MLPTINGLNSYLNFTPTKSTSGNPAAKPGSRPSTPARPFYSNSTAHTITSSAAVSSSVIPSSQSLWLGTLLAKKNGTPDYPTLRTAIQKYRSKEGRIELDPIIGCIILSDPFFFPEQDWIDVSGFWPKNLTQGKTFDTEDELGRNIWDRVSQRITRQNVIQNEPNLDLTAGAVKERYGDPYLTRPRLGQGAFRVLVTDAYQRRCAITGEKTLPVLNASHIKPYSQNGPHEVRNGLLLREDLHTLFDRGYLTVTKDYRVEVSKRIKEDYGNGRDYYAMHGRRLMVLPENAMDLPGVDYLEWHNERVYAG